MPGGPKRRAGWERWTRRPEKEETRPERRWLGRKKMGAGGGHGGRVSATAGSFSTFGRWSGVEAALQPPKLYSGVTGQKRDEKPL